MGKSKSHGIFSLLQVEHPQFQQLFLVADKVDSSNMFNCWNQINELLSLRTRAEDRVFYSAMQECEPTKKYIEDAKKQDAGAKVLLERDTKLVMAK